MRISLIAALDRNRAIGVDNRLPWHLPDDLRRFKSLTMNRPMIMGRRTFDSLPGLLPGRRHIVLTRDSNWSAPGAEVAGSAEEALALGGARASVIGGAEIIALFEPLADAWELTEVHRNEPGDTFLSPINTAHWREVRREDHDGFSFVRLERR